MPVYEYACSGCGHEFEAEQRITEAPIKTCPRCRARKVKRLISQTSFVLKGSGWYADLYSSKASKDAGGTKADAGGTAKSDATGESAPAAASGASETAASEAKPKPKGEGKRGKSKPPKAAA